MRAAIANGALSAALINLCLVGLPFAAAPIAREIAAGAFVSYIATPAALTATRAALEREAAHLLAPGMERRRAWEELIARELREGDPRAARGFALMAPALLGPADGARLDAALRADADDAARAAAAARLLSNETRQPFAEATRHMATTTRDDLAVRLALDTERAFAEHARAWHSGRDSDDLAFVLAGIVTALGEHAPPRVALGASVLIDARRAARLRPGLAAHLSRAAARAAPVETLRRAMDEALADPDALTRGGRLTAQAFRASLDPVAYGAFAEELAVIGDIARATSPRGAVRLLAHARDGRDLPRLRLIAQAGGDRATAFAKRWDGAPPLAELARGTTIWTRARVHAVGALIALVLGLLIAGAVSLTHALRQMAHAAN